MKGFPHHYSVAAATNVEGNVTLTSKGLAPIESAPPAEFDGPGDQWSPETLLVAAVVDCFILTFKAVARGAKMDWIALSCDAEGILDRVDNVSRFTEIRLHATLDVPQGTDEEKARRLLEKSEHACLITNSLKSESHLVTDVRQST